jgi:hypothetical protein
VIVAFSLRLWRETVFAAGGRNVDIMDIKRIKSYDLSYKIKSLEIHVDEYLQVLSL